MKKVQWEGVHVTTRKKHTFTFGFTEYHTRDQPSISLYVHIHHCQCIELVGRCFIAPAKHELTMVSATLTVCLAS